jgi:hypothetical protein
LDGGLITLRVSQKEFEIAGVIPIDGFSSSKVLISALVVSPSVLNL